MLSLEYCWAKTDDRGLPALTALNHCFNVGAVGREVALRLSGRLRDMLPDGHTLLIAAHDLGKISPGFLMKCQTWRSEWQGRLGLTAPDQYEGSHAIISQKVLSTIIERPSRWLIAVGGHHGRYLCKNAKPAFCRIVGSGIFEDLRGELISLLEAEFGSMPDIDAVDKGARLHWFTGLMIFSDWIGSNTTWFPFSLPPAESGAAACRALDEMGWHHHAVRQQRSFRDLFSLDSPRPLQRALYDAMDQPGLYVVEAPMGEGKTEAALLGAYRRWCEGPERGLYFALPTQLTSDRIHDRVNAFLRNVVADESAMVLVHGNAWLHESRIHPIRPSLPACEKEEPDPAADGNRWFSDNRRALLAPFGVGTVDQALMSVLPVKFSALRMFALGGKVVVIDEVHSYDPYTSAIVDRAVQWLLELGSTVIILSATLTVERRQSLLQAAGASNSISRTDYPLISKVVTGSEEAVAIPIGEETPASREVRTACASGCHDDWMQEATAAAEAGACVLVIRNTVALAQETLRLLASRCRDLGIRTGLIHSRFTQSARMENEARWMTLLGKDQTQRPNNGAILVGTQVLEQSVDIDADFLITDLAPTDLILQRLGRLHRHTRPRPAGFEQARCLILCPEVDWLSDAKSIEEQLKPHGLIYPPFSLYMAWRVWSERTSISLPGEIREVLEASVAATSCLPEGVGELLVKLDHLTQSMRSAAWTNDVFKEAGIDDIEGVPTRWEMQPTGHLVVLRRKPEQSANQVTVCFPGGNECSIIPGLFHFPLARLLHLHAIRLPLYMIRDFMNSAPPWLQQHFPGAVLTVIDDHRNLHPTDGPESPAYSFQYREDLGLVPERNPQSTFQASEDNESWF